MPSLKVRLKILRKKFEKIFEKILTNTNLDIIIVIVVRTASFIYADVAELVDAQDLKSCG